MTQHRLSALILSLFLIIQTACTNGVSHLEADGDEEKIALREDNKYNSFVDGLNEQQYKIWDGIQGQDVKRHVFKDYCEHKKNYYHKKFLKRLATGERSLWDSIQDEGFKAAFVEYHYTKRKKPKLFNLKEGKKYFQGNKDHFIKYILEKNYPLQDKVKITYKYLCRDLAGRIGDILDYVGDINSAKKLIKDFRSYLSKHDLQFIDYVFEYYKEESLNQVIQGYIASKKCSLEYQTKYILDSMEEDVFENLEIIKGLWGQLYKDNKQYVDYTFSKPSLTREDIENAQAYTESRVAEKVGMVLWDVKKMGQTGVEIICHLLKYNDDSNKAKADDVIVKAIMKSNALDAIARYNIIYNGVFSSLFKLSEETFKMISKSFGKQAELMLLLSKKRWGKSTDML